MNGIISIVVFICLFSAGASNAEYYVEPLSKPAETMASEEGLYWKLWVPPYWAPYWQCFTDQEVLDWAADNPGGFSDLNEEMGTCTKCTEHEYSLLPYNGEDVCIHYIPCTDDYQFMNYNGRDDCFKCPDNYQFNSEHKCQWAGPGPQPPPTPTGLEASNGASDEYILVSWDKASSEVISYNLYRIRQKDFRRNPVLRACDWPKVATIPNENALGSKILYYDKNVQFPQQTYYYSIQACYQSMCGSCSAFESGYKGHKLIINILNILLRGTMVSDRPKRATHDRAN